MFHSLNILESRNVLLQDVILKEITSDVSYQSKMLYKLCKVFWESMCFNYSETFILLFKTGKLFQNGREIERCLPDFSI